MRLEYPRRFAAAPAVGLTCSHPSPCTGIGPAPCARPSTLCMAPFAYRLLAEANNPADSAGRLAAGAVRLEVLNCRHCMQPAGQHWGLPAFALSYTGHSASTPHLYTGVKGIPITYHMEHAYLQVALFKLHSGNPNFNPKLNLCRCHPADCLAYRGISSTCQLPAGEGNICTKKDGPG